MRQMHSRRPQEKRSQNQAAQVHETAAAVGAYGRGMSASSLCMFVRGRSLSVADAQFVLVHQQVMIRRHSDLFARCRAICCDSVATDGTKRDCKNGLWFGTNARGDISHTTFNRCFEASGDSVSAVRSALHRPCGTGSTERHQDLGLGLSDSRLTKDATAVAGTRVRRQPRKG